MSYNQYSHFLFFSILFGNLALTAFTANATDQTPGQLVSEPVFNGQTYVIEAGLKNKKDVILVHGLGHNGAKDWAQLVPVLAQHYHVITFDLPGFGRSSQKNALYSPANYAKFVKWIADKYSKRPFTLIGHSMGGAIALYYAATYPKDLQQLILVDAAGILHRAAFTKNATLLPTKQWWWQFVPPTVSDQINDFINATIEMSENLPFNPDVILNSASNRQRFLNSDPLKIAALAMIQQNFSRLIERVKTPTYLLWGANDAVTPIRTGKLLAAKIDNAQLRIIARAAHVPMRDQPQLFNELVLNRISAPLSSLTSTAKPIYSDANKDRKGYCNQENNRTFTGTYQRIDILDCKKVRIVNTTSGYINIVNSQVEIENSLIQSNLEQVGLNLRNSHILATALTINANIAISTSQSHLDLAGVELQAESNVLQTKDSSTVIFSVSHIKTPHKSSYVHGLFSTTKDTLF